MSGRRDPGKSGRFLTAVTVLICVTGILPGVVPATLADIPGTFTTTGSMGTARLAHTATLLPNGKVLIAGGSNLTGGMGRQLLR